MTGTVTVSPGIDLTPRNTSFVFSNSTIGGSIEVTQASPPGALTFNGFVNLPAVTGQASNETTVTGTGTVNPFTATGTDASGLCTIRADVRGGIFVRVGPVVVVVFTDVTIHIVCNLPVVGRVEVTGDAVITVEAVFVPTSGDGVTTPVTQAQFVGGFETAPAP